ncbi:ABC transporter G family member 51-like [Homarus americanus]|uniref:ABC transporter G family member 51-like n=1 Tax=Homarus americanus TaxID=6706 RepID=UPI001C481924|nr:ABC transporter G family member 51-like [Homarus americanus]
MELSQERFLCDDNGMKAAHYRPRPQSRDRPVIDVVFSESEGSCLLDILANRHAKWGGRLRGDLILNGNHTRPSKVAARAAYVQQDVNFCPDMSVRQTLLLHSFFRSSGDHSRVREVKARINGLINDLGLEQVRHTRVKELTLSERRRLNVACHLLLETDLVLLDQPTRGMDIFDTFFLIEYLRQWACRGRIVILTIQPPTYEIFSMISRVALISTGRLMYFGRRREMLPYFAFIEYPCPAYKNPSDYYLGQQLNLNYACVCFSRAMIYQFPYNMVNWLGMTVVAGVMSVVVGAVYWDVRTAPTQHQDNVNNRVAFHYVMAGVALWPILLMAISEVWRDKPALARDVDDGLYSRGIYILTKICYSFLAAGGTFLAYILPAYTMAGFPTADKFYFYLGYMLLYLFAARAVAIAAACVFDARHTAAMTTGFVMTVAVLGAGFTVHPLDMSAWTWPTLWWSPARWVLHEVNRYEFDNTNEFLCDRNPVLQDSASAIQRKAPCGVVTGSQALRYLGLPETALPDLFYPAVFIVVAYLFSQLISVIAFIASKKPNRTKKYRTE